MSVTLSVVIPTYRREQELRRCLDSIFLQTQLPDEVLIIDDDVLSQEFVTWVSTHASEHGVSLEILSKLDLGLQKGTSQSRNLGIERVVSDVMLLLDDDVVLAKDHIERLVEQWNNTQDVNLLGISGVLTNERVPSFLENVFHQIFGLHSDIAWDVTPVAYQVWNDGISEQVKGYYANGCASSFSVEKLRALGGFRVFSDGRNALEDVEFFLRAKQQGYFMIIDPLIQAIHEHTPTSRESSYQTGVREGENRVLIFRDLGKKDFYHQLWFEWSSVGWILRQFFARNYKKGAGMFIGMFRV